MSFSFHSFQKRVSGLFSLPLVVGLVLLAGCGPLSPGTISSGTATTGTISSGTATIGTRTMPPLEKLHMFTAQIGWAISPVSSQTARILHTSTGVNAWQDVTPVGAQQLSIPTATMFFDPLNAWVAVDNLLYRTHDAGQTWEQAHINDQGTLSQIDFLTHQLGWALVKKAAFTGNMVVDLLRTTDGGASWQIISVSNTPSQTHPGAIPFQGTKSGLTFVSPTTGWVTGFTNTGHEAWLYMTQDGGVSWQRQTLSLPEDAFQVTTIVPTFFSATDGTLPVVIPGSAGQIVTLYVTHDGGRHWTPTMAVSTTSFAENIHEVDSVHSFIVSNTVASNSNHYLQSTLYRTSDGGTHWTSFQAKLGADIIQIDFLSPTLGWAINSLHALYQTTDGGQTWVKV